MTITLATLKDATAQQVFDQVATHLLTQAKRSMGSYGGCAYKNADGLKCAAGCLISDNEYHESIEDKNWMTLAGRCAPSTHSVLIRRLQVVHDCVDIKPNAPSVLEGSELKAFWIEKLSRVAIQENLSPAVLEEFKTSE